MVTWITCLSKAQHKNRNAEMSLKFIEGTWKDCSVTIMLSSALKFVSWFALWLDFS
mgnify:CR=1 FL=1